MMHDNNISGGVQSSTPQQFISDNEKYNGYMISNYDQVCEHIKKCLSEIDKEVFREDGTTRIIYNKKKDDTKNTEVIDVDTGGDSND